MTSPLSPASRRRVAAVLAGRHAYDLLRSDEQAAVRAAWKVDIAERLERLDLATKFTANRRSWVELNDAAQVVKRVPNVDGSVAHRVLRNSVSK